MSSLGSSAAPDLFNRATTASSEGPSTISLIADILGSGIRPQPIALLPPARSAEEYGGFGKALGRNPFERSHRLGQGNEIDCRSVQCHHLVGGSVVQPIDGVETKAGSEHPVESGRSAPPLDVPEHCGPCLLPRAWAISDSSRVPMPVSRT